MNQKVVIIAICVIIAIISLYFVMQKVRKDFSCPKGMESVNGDCAVSPKPATQASMLTSSPGTGVLDAVPYFSTSFGDIDTFPELQVTNRDFQKNSPYSQLIAQSIGTIPQTDKSTQYQQFINYFNAVYYNLDQSALKTLTQDQLRGWYRSMAFYFMTTPNSQPDGGWKGSYWKNRVLENINHNKQSGCTNMTAHANESFLFDGSITGSATSRKNLWGNRIFLEAVQSSLRRGTRGSPQVLSSNPSWEGRESVYGTGGFPAFSYVELLQFPQEHGVTSSDVYQYGMGNPTGCDANDLYNKQLIWCPKGYSGYPCTEGFAADPAAKPMFQPPADASNSAWYPGKPQWFYFAQGLGQFFDLGRTYYTYNYVDLFLNSPSDIGWSNSYPGKAKGGALGFLPDGKTPKEHDIENPIYSMKLILEYLSRTVYPGACNGVVSPTNPKPTSTSAVTDPNTGLPGLGYCAPDTNGNCSFGSQNCTCTQTRGCSGTSYGGTYSLDKQVAAAMGFDTYRGMGQYWSVYKNEQGSWSKSCVPSGASYPERNTSWARLIDNRYLVTGWVNGNFYGYPTGDCMCTEKDPQGCMKPPRTVSGQLANCEESCNPFRFGMPGTDPKDGKVIYGKHFTKDEPLVYLDKSGKPICQTWYGRPLVEMCQEGVTKFKSGKNIEEVALLLVSEMYSTGDTGFEAADYNWPFGSYFAYGQDLGSPGKDLVEQLASKPYNVTSVQFTMTPTSYSPSVTQPAYDFEVLVIPFAAGPTGPSMCASAVSLDLMADVKNPKDAKKRGEEFKQYCSINKGRIGGYIPVDSVIGNTAKAFNGKQQKVSNFTTLDANGGTFNPTSPNVFSGHSNDLSS